MDITIKDENNRFGVRVAAIIYNSDMTKIFLQKQRDHDFYMFPGGRLEIGENSEKAIVRELKEELNIENEKIYLKYIAESFIKFPNKKYHEIGFYFTTMIDEKKYNFTSGNKYNSYDEKNDGKSVFEWLSIDDLKNVKIMPDYIKDKIINGSAKLEFGVEHLINREYE